MGSTLFYFYGDRLSDCFINVVFSAATNEFRIDPGIDIVDIQECPDGDDPRELFIT